MKIIPLPLESVALTGFSHKAVIDYNDVLALGASATGTIQLSPLTGTGVIGMTCLRAAVRLITAFDFSDAAINSLLAEVGDGNSTARLLGQTELAADGSYVTAKVSATAYAYPIADSIDIKFTAAGGGSPTLAEATSGKVEVYLRLVDINDLVVLG